MSDDTPRQYSEKTMKIVAKHPETGEDTIVLVSKFEHSLSAVCGALGRLGIEFYQKPAS